MSTKIAKALIGGNWKCNGTVASIKSMAEVLNKGGAFSANSEVVIAAPAIHLLSLKSILRPDIAVCAEVSYNIIVISMYHVDLIFVMIMLGRFIQNWLWSFYWRAKRRHVGRCWHPLDSNWSQ